MKKVDLFTHGKVSELVNALKYYEELAAEFEAGRVTDLSIIEAAFADFDPLGESIVALDGFVHQNSEGFRKALKKYKKVTSRSVVWFTRSYRSHILYKASCAIHELVVALSNIRKRFRTVRDRAGNGEWEPPAQFSRTTKKYWVKLRLHRIQAQQK